nr:serine hydrolase domain-containing protein [Marinicella sp. W31]MDC2875702.1 serine hydrolase [Marinicella sp. W31]
MHRQTMCMNNMIYFAYRGLFMNLWPKRSIRGKRRGRGVPAVIRACDIFKGRNELPVLVSFDLLKRRSLPLLIFLLLTTGGLNAAAAAEACVQDVDHVLSMSPAKIAGSEHISGELASKLDDAVTMALHQSAAPGVIVGVRTPEGSWMKGFGISDPETGAPMEAGMKTRIGSVTKTFTGTVILKLAEGGQLSLDDTIDTYVAGIPNGDKITLRQLANMTSGVASYTASVQFVDLYLQDPNTLFHQRIWWRMGSRTLHSSNPDLNTTTPTPTRSCLES